MELVVNEWLPDYLIKTAGSAENKLALHFLNKFLQSNDIIVVKAPSPFTLKISSYQKQFSGYPDASRNLKGVQSLVLRNSQKARIIYEEEIIAIPEQTHNLLHTPGTNYNSDYYLFESAHLTQSKIIITTDVKLQNFMSVDTNFKIVLLQDFLLHY